MRLLLLGETAGSARYLTGAFARAGLTLRHVEARQQLERLEEPFDTVLFSDYPARQLAADAAAQIESAVQGGAGLLMIGGWTSFTGKGDGYRDTPVGALLPVECATQDDRRNVSSGLWFEAAERGHPILRDLDLDHPPVLCGYNAILPRSGTTLLARGRLVEFQDGVPQAGAAVPLLVAGEAGQGRVLAYAGDLVPHWCGGVVDWGAQRIALPGGAEVGEGYCTFLLNMVRWAAGDSEHRQQN